MGIMSQSTPNDAGVTAAVVQWVILHSDVLYISFLNFLLILCTRSSDVVL